MASPQVTGVGTPTMVRATTGAITGSWGTGQNRTISNLLVALVSAGGSTASAAAISTPAGWTQQATIGNTTGSANAWVAVYTKAAAGSDAAPAFTATLTGTVAMTCTLLELSAAADVVPVDTSGTFSSGGSSGTLTAMTVTTGAPVSTSSGYAVTIYCQEAAAATNTWNVGSGWSNLTNDGGTSSVLHTAVDSQVPAVQAAATETAHWTTNATAFGTAIIVSFAPQYGGLEVYTNDAQTTISSGGTGAPAAGTPEVWTAASWSSFPVASQTTTPPTSFHIADVAVAASAEMIEVLNTTTGLVIRGSQGTTPVAHSAGFAVQNVIPGGNQQPRYYNVRDPQFGATGNGSTDDTAALQAALEAAYTSGGGVVYVPEGIYLISQTLQIGSNTTLKGAGTGAATIRCKASSLSGFLQVGTNTGAPMLGTWGTVAQSRIQVGPGITLDGNQANAGSLPGFADAPESSPLSLWLVSLATVTGIEVINAVGYSIYLNACTDSSVTGCRVLAGAGSALGTNQQDGIHLTNSSKCRVENNDVDTGTGTAGDDGIAVQAFGAACTDIVVSGNVVRAAAHGIALVSGGNALTDLSVQDNIIYASKNEAVICYQDAGSVSQATSINISNNSAYNIATSSGAGIACEMPCTGLTVAGNSLSTFGNTSATGIFVINGQASGAITDVTITGNTVTGQPGFFGIQVGSTGTAQAVTYASVTGNTIDLSTATAGNLPIGIELAACTYGTVTGNTLLGNSDSTSVAIYMVGATGEISVTGNAARNFGFGVTWPGSGTIPNNNTYAANNLVGCTTAYALSGANELILDQVIAGASGGGQADIEQFTVLNAVNTLTNNTNPQKIFNASATGALTIPVGTFFFESEFDISGLSGSSHNLAFGIGGTANISSVKYKADSNTVATGTIGAWSSAVITTTAATNVLAAANTGTSAEVALRGVIRANTAGTIIPQVTQVTASAAATVSTNSWFRVWPAGGTAVTTAGAWS